MVEIKRLNYFTSQFLVEEDFQDEQAYHREMRYQHNRSLHSWGVVTGLVVSKTGDKQVSVSSGMAIDRDGHEIVLPSDPPPAPLNLAAFAPETDVYITITYQEIFDEDDRYQSGGVDNYTRTTERPLLAATSSSPPADGSVILLAQVSLDQNGNVVEAEIDASGVVRSSAAIANNAITTIQIADSSVTEDKIADGTINAAKIQDGTVGTAELANNSVTNAKIADGTINAAKIQDGTVGNAELQNNAVTTSKIANAAVTASKIAAGVIPPDISIAISTALGDGATIPPPTGFSVSECVFFAFPKNFTVPAAGGQFIVFANDQGEVTATAPDGGSVIAAGVAIAKRGGW